MRQGDRIVVTDPATADFGAPGRVIADRPIDEHYPYRRRNPLWHLVSAILYYLVFPLPAYAIGLAHGLRFRHREAVRRLGGCYLYGNHTHWFDAVLPYLLAFPRRAYIVAGPTAVSVPLVRYLVPMLGAIPLNPTPAGKAAFRAACAAAVRRGCPVAIYPEAHEWPYYNGVRDFSPAAFTYPVRTGAPVLPFAVTYRRRPVFARRAPHMTVTVGEAILPEAWQGAADPRTVLRDAVHAWLCDTVAAQHSYAWVDYVLPEPGTEDAP